MDSPADAAVFASVAGVRNVTANDKHVEMSFYGDMGELLKAAIDRYGVADIKTGEADLEEIFLTYYKSDKED